MTAQRRCERGLVRRKPKKQAIGTAAIAVITNPTPPGPTSSAICMSGRHSNCEKPSFHGNTRGYAYSIAVHAQGTIHIQRGAPRAAMEAAQTNRPNDKPSSATSTTKNVQATLGVASTV